MNGRRSVAHPADQAVVAVVGGMIMDLIFETERMPAPDESLDAKSLVYKPGGKGSNTAVAIYRTQHNRPGRTGADPLDDSGGGGGSSNSNSTVLTNRAPAPVANPEDEPSFEVLVYMNTAVGDDAHGQTLTQNLQKNGVDISGVQQHSNEQTGTCAVFVEESTGRSRDIGCPGANTNWTPRDWDSVTCLAGGNRRPDLLVAHLESRRETVERVLELASRSGVDTLLNPSPVSYLPGDIYRNVTHLLVNEREAAELSARGEEELATPEAYREAARYFLDQGVGNVVITVGGKGAFYMTAHEYGLVPAVTGVKVKDTTGAGDTFVGNYAYEYIRQKHRGRWNIKEAVERGCRAAARTIEKLGAQEAIPWADEIDLG